MMESLSVAETRMVVKAGRQADWVGGVGSLEFRRERSGKKERGN